jgi:hypothetical protein
MVEVAANSVEDKLIDGLSFKLKPGASYVSNRRSCTFHPQGSNIYKPGSGTKLIKILLSGDDYLDPSTFRIAFNVTNNSPSKIYTIGDPHSFFQRVRVIVGGQVLEDISEYSRTHEMIMNLRAKHSRENSTAEGFGVVWDNQKYKTWEPTTSDAGSAHVRALREATFGGLNPGQSQRVLFKPLIGLFEQNKMLPLRYMPITIELELVSTPDEPMLSFFRSYEIGLEVMSTGVDGFSGSTNPSDINWQIENVEAKCDLLTLDSQLDNSFAEHLLGGGSLPINYNTFISQMQTVSGTKLGVNVSRAVTRLKSIFVSLQKDVSGAPGYKGWNTFWSPMSPENRDGTITYADAGEFKFYVQIGSKLFPEYPIQSHSEAYYQLKKTLGIQSSNVHSFDITAREYRDNKMILAVDTEKVLEAGWTGLNTRAGDLMRVVFEYKDPNATLVTRLANSMHIVLQSDQIVEVRNTGVQVLD